VTSDDRLCIIGLDGVPIGLLRRLADQGVMPRVGERIAAAHLRPMRASLPEISSVSWTSFMTGAQAGEHGVFGFTDIRPDDYQLTFPTFPAVPVPTIWDRLGQRGRRSLVVNQPATYPARPIPGTLISGFVAIDLRRSVQPLAHLATLRRLDYRIDIDTLAARRDHDALFVDLHATLRARRDALWQLWDAERWDLLQVVVTGTDRLYHYLFDALDDPDHPRHEAALDYHAAVDRFVGEVFDRFRSEQPNADQRFWMLSDHGFCAIRSEVQVNAALRRAGLLQIDDATGRDLGGIADASRAFALDPGRIYVHRRDRFARGLVDPTEVEAVKEEVADLLLQLRYHGEPVIREVFDAAKIYSGPHAADGPDLVALSHPGFDLKASPSATEVFGRSDLVGMHTYDDAFLLAPRPVEGDLWIGDLAAILLDEWKD
jgi:predicted AlkP superfamily phosphohydrolase/phosphomutase